MKIYTDLLAIFIVYIFAESRLLSNLSHYLL